MPKTRQEKEVVIDTLSKLFKESSSVVFANYQGLSVPQVENLRDKMHEGNVTYVVAKKTLINRAAKEAGYELDSKQFPGMLGLAFGSDDEVAPAKIFGDMTKDTSLQLVGGLFNGNVVSQEYVVSLSKLPSRQQLYGMFVSVIYGPVSGFVRALDAIRLKKEEQYGTPATSEAAPTPEEKPAEEVAAFAESAAEIPKSDAAEALTEEKPAEESETDGKPAEESPKE